MSKRIPLPERIARSTEIDENDCWLWQLYCEPAGYGRITIDERVRYAHVISYEVHVGPIPDGHEIDHLCRVRNCVNPEHLEAVTKAENAQRSWSAIGDERRAHLAVKIREVFESPDVRERHSEGMRESHRRRGHRVGVGSNH